MGGRLLKRWLALPLKNAEEIKKRHEVVKFFIKNDEYRQEVVSQLNEISDLERLVSKAATGRISPKEVNSLKNSLKVALQIKIGSNAYPDAPIRSLTGQIDECQQLVSRIEETLEENAPVQINKGNVITAGVSAELDELRIISNSGKKYLEEIVHREIEKTQISSLKIAYNNVFGYYLEVRNTHKDKVPENWIRKQTLVSAERYITEELKAYESKILGAQEKILALENNLYRDLVTFILPFITRIQKNSFILSQLDCLGSFALSAVQDNYIRPVIDNSTDIEISHGRHPVIERQLKHGEEYIANDIVLNRNQQQVIMITGPNMSGKSAILRQTALIVLLAQIGSFVPAQNARIGVVDKIFTRVGASDNISMGESTFMVEMNETANILNNLSERSLILLDEIGRGTSTYDGISIAWSISEYIHEHPTRAKTLFATHYHELNDMSESLKELKTSMYLSKN